MEAYAQSLAVCKAKNQDARNAMKEIIIKNIISQAIKIPIIFVPDTGKLKQLFNTENVELLGKFIKETAKNTTLSQIDDVYSNLKALVEMKEMYDTAGLIQRARKLQSVINHMDGAIKDFFFSVGLDDAFFAAMDTDLGHWVVNNAGQAKQSLELIISHVRAGDFWQTLIEDGKRTDWNQMQKEHLQFGKDLSSMFVVSLGQGSYNLAERGTERIRGVADFIINNIVLPTLNKVSNI